MKTIFHKNLKAFTLCAGFFSLVACREKTTINPELLDQPDNINTFGVTGLQMTINNTHFDSLRTNDYDYPLVAIGGITDDPFFGKTMAGAYIQLIAPFDNYAFPTGAVIDSSILSIPYSGFSYGDTARSNAANQLKLKVYEATQTFGYDLTTPLYAFSKLTYNTNPLKTVSVPISSLTDTFALNSKDTVSKLLRIRMDTLGNRFKYMTENGQAVTNAAFVQNFKGLYIAPDTNAPQNTIGYFGLFGGNSTVNYSRAQVEVYYHTPTVAFARAFFNYATTLTGFFNTIVKNYGNLPASSYYNNQTGTHDSMEFPVTRASVSMLRSVSRPIAYRHR
ncbi:MAG: DUF4270 family protein [Sphingobacteriales bacterium]|nr:MAG: DUF4270 family protein [Sphingobacteriales bacterium]